MLKNKTELEFRPWQAPGEVLAWADAQVVWQLTEAMNFRVNETCKYKSAERSPSNSA